MLKYEWSYRIFKNALTNITNNLAIFFKFSKRQSREDQKLHNCIDGHHLRKLRPEELCLYDLCRAPNVSEINWEKSSHFNRIKGWKLQLVLDQNMIIHKRDGWMAELGLNAVPDGLITKFDIC